MKGTIRKRGDKFQVIFPYKDDEGNWKQRSKTAATQSQANAILKKFNYEQDAVKVDNPKFSEVAKMWIDEKSLKSAQNTINTYRSNVDFILQRLKDIGIKDYKRKDFVDLYRSIFESGYEAKAYKGTINMVMAYAIRLNLITSNPAQGIGIERTEKKKDATMFSQRERIEILNDLDGTVYYYMVYIVLKTGLRIGELQGLHWKNVDLEKRELNICQQMLASGEITDRLKTENSYRIVTLDTETVELFLDFAKSPYNNGGLLFPNRNYRSRLNTKLWKYAATAHDLRHNHGTDLLKIATVADAAARMGHTVEEYIKTYVHPTNAEQKSIADKLNAPEYSLCDRFVTEEGGKVVKMTDINARRSSSL